MAVACTEGGNGGSWQQGEDGHTSSSKSSSGYADAAWSALLEETRLQLSDAEFKEQQVEQGLLNMRHQMTRPWSLQEKEQQLNAICDVMEELGSGFKGGVRTQVGRGEGA